MVTLVAEHPGDPNAYYDQHGNRYLILSHTHFIRIYNQLLIQLILSTR